MPVEISYRSVDEYLGAVGAVANSIDLTLRKSGILAVVFGRNDAGKKQIVVDEVYLTEATVKSEKKPDISDFYHLLTSNKLVVSAGIKMRTFDDHCIADPDSSFSKRINAEGVVSNFCLLKPTQGESSRSVLVAYVQGLETPEFFNL